MKTQFSLGRSFLGGASSSFCGWSRGSEKLLPRSSPLLQQCGYGCGPGKFVNENKREMFLSRTCLLSPPAAGRRMKIPRTREGKPRILCYPHSIPLTWCSRRGYGSSGAFGHSSADLVRPRRCRCPSVGSPACLPSAEADRPTTPPASCLDHMTPF